MSEQSFLTRAGNFLENMADQIEDIDIEAKLSIEFYDGILEIIDESDRTDVINQHSATEKIWYSSPFSGADYFSYKQNEWQNKDGISLVNKLAAELESNYAIKINV